MRRWLREQVAWLTLGGRSAVFLAVVSAVSALNSVGAGGGDFSSITSAHPRVLCWFSSSNLAVCSSLLLPSMVVLSWSIINSLFFAVKLIREVDVSPTSPMVLVGSSQVPISGLTDSPITRVAASCGASSSTVL